MKQVIANNPESVIQILEKYPDTPKAQIVLFKILVGTHNYKKANIVYKKIGHKSEEIDSIYAGIISHLGLKPEKQQTILLKLNIDTRLKNLYLADIMESINQHKKARILLQKLLSQISEQDPAYQIVKNKINNLPS